MSGPGFLILWLNNLEQTNWSYNVPLVFVKPLVLGLIFRKHAHDHVDSTCFVRLGIALPSLVSFLKWSHNFGASIGTYHFIIVGSMCSYGFAPATRTQIGGPSVRAVTEITCHLATAYKKIIICKKPSKTETAAMHPSIFQVDSVSFNFLATVACFWNTLSSTPWWPARALQDNVLIHTQIFWSICAKKMNIFWFGRVPAHRPVLPILPSEIFCRDHRTIVSRKVGAVKCMHTCAIPYLILAVRITIVSTNAFVQTRG